MRLTFPNKVLHSNNDVFYEIYDILDLVEGINRKIDFLLDGPPTKEIFQHKISDYKEKETNKILKSIPIKELNRDRIGIRITALENAGFNNIYEVSQAGAQQLLLINGIGPGNVKLIVDTIEKIKGRTLREINFPPRYSCHSAEANEIYKSGYIYFHTTCLYKECAGVLKEFKTLIDKKYKVIQAYRSKWKWFWTLSSRKREKIYCNALGLRQVLSDEKVSAINKAFEYKKRITDVSADVAIKDFNEHIALYEEIFRGNDLTYQRESNCEVVWDSLLLKENTREILANNKKIAPSWGGIYSIAAIVAVVALCISISIHNLKEINSAYQEALQYIDSEKYLEAERIFSKIGNYRDARPLATYCHYAELYKDEFEYIGGTDAISSISLRYDYKYQSNIDDMESRLRNLESDKELKEQMEEQRKIAEKEQNIIASYKNNMPELGMSEKYIKYTQLGHPDKIEKCLNFDYLDPRARSKEYTWGNIGDKDNYFNVTVRYRRHWSHQFDDYTDYPDGEGYVFSVSYYGEDGYFHVDDMMD